MKSRLSSFLLLLIFLIGLSLMLYPTFSDWWNSFHQSRAVQTYRQAVKELPDYGVFFRDAQAYNDELSQLNFPLMYYDRVEGYENLLNAAGNGILGTVKIPKIQVNLPIYHGTSDSVLQVAVGHLEGSSLPTGEKGTHCVLSAHRGLPSARLFTDLDKLETGDRFTLTVLDQELTYEVDRILVVEPQQVQSLYTVEGEDLCTLMTCTPYGINTHRLLVRGRRVYPEKAPAALQITADAQPLSIAPAAAILASPVLISLLLILLIPKRRYDP